MGNFSETVALSHGRSKLDMQWVYFYIIKMPNNIVLNDLITFNCI